MTLHTDKELKSKNFRGKIVHILAKDIDSKIEIEYQSQKNFGLKKAYFFGHPNSDSCVQNAKTLLQNIFLFTKY